LKEQKKIEFEQKSVEIETRISKLKKKNFFTTFIIENSDQDIYEVEILATIFKNGKCNMNEIKKQLDITPIMAVRTIRQLAVQGIIDLNEDTNEMSIIT